MNSPSETMSLAPEMAKTVLSDQGDIPVLVIHFEKVNEYTTFAAEHGVDGKDLIFHFFKTEENNSRDYWRRVFLIVHQFVAMRVFYSRFPRQRAAFTYELDSWWLRAFGFADIGDPPARVKYFLEQLDQALEAANTSKPLA